MTERSDPSTPPVPVPPAASGGAPTPTPTGTGGSDLPTPPGLDPAMPPDVDPGKGTVRPPATRSLVGDGELPPDGSDRSTISNMRD